MPAILEAPAEAIAAAAIAAAAPAPAEVAKPLFTDDDAGDAAEKVKRLPDLLSMTTDKPLHTFIPDWMQSWCNKPHLASQTYNPIPERPEWLTMLGGVTPWSAVIKNDDVKEEKDDRGNSTFYRLVNGVKTPVKAKSYAGYVWVSTDPIDLLTNRFVMYSCHRLDNLNNHYRAGNFTYLSCPWFAVVAADKEHPLKNLVDASPKGSDEKRYLCADGQRIKMRNHQATANIMFMRDKNQRPFLYLSMIYDACVNDVPWTKRIVQFLYNRCERLGIGLAVSTYVRQEKYRHKGNIELRTPDFKFLTGKNHAALISGDYSYCYMRPNGNLFIQVSSNYMSVLLEPTVKGQDDFAPLVEWATGGGNIEEDIQFLDAVLLNKVAEQNCVDLNAGVEGAEPFIVNKTTRDDAKKLIALYAFNADAKSLCATANLGKAMNDALWAKVNQAYQVEKERDRRPQILLGQYRDADYVNRIRQLLNTAFVTEEWGAVRDAAIRQRIAEAREVLAALEPELPVGAEVTLPEPEPVAAKSRRRAAAAA